MKKLMFIIITFYCSIPSFSQNKQKLELNVVRVYPIQSNFDNDCEYNIEIELINNTLKPVFFWSWSNDWSLNFIIKDKKFKFYVRVISEYPINIMLLPKLKKKFQGIIYSRRCIGEINSLSIGFLFYNGIKINRMDFSKTILYSTSFKNMNNLPKPDTIWNAESIFKTKNYNQKL